MFVSFTDQRPVLIDSLGNPLSYGEVTFCDQGTTTPKTIYSDEARTVAITNPQIMDISGRPVDQIFLGVGDYTCFVKRFIGADILTAIPADWTDDNQFDISGVDSPVSIATTATVDTIADLKNIDSAVYQSVTVLGYFAKGDCPARVFIWSASESGAENLGTIVSSFLSVSGRWMYQPISVIDIRTFGAVPGGVNCNGAITNAEAWANSLTNHSVTIYFPKGIYSVSGTVTQPLRVPVAIDKGVTLLNTVTGHYKLDIQSGYSIDLETALGSVSSVGYASLKFSGTLEGVVKSEWFGENEFTFGLMVRDVANNYTWRINQAVDASLAISGGTVTTRLSFGPSGSLLLDGSGYVIKPISVHNENISGCFYYITAGRLDLSLLSAVKTSWFRSALDSALLFNGSYLQSVGTVLNIDADCTVSTEVSTNSGWVINALGGIINLNAGLICGAIQAGDIGLFNGLFWVAHQGVTNLSWFLYANSDKDEALNSAIQSAKRSISATLDGRNIPQSYSSTKIIDGSIRMVGLEYTGPSLDLRSACIFDNCKIVAVDYGIYSNNASSAVIENCYISGVGCSITSDGTITASNSSIFGNVVITGNANIDHCNLGSSSLGTSLEFSGTTQITNCQIRTPIISKDASGTFGQTLICNNVFIGSGSIKPNWTLMATTAGSLASSMIIKDNIFTGSYSGATDSCVASVSGSGTFALLQKILITDNKTTSANVVIKATKGSAIGSYAFSHVGSGITIGSVDLNLAPVFTIPSYVLNATYDLALVQQPRSSVGISTASGTLYVMTVSGLGYVSGASPVSAYINFDLYR